MQLCRNNSEANPQPMSRRSFPAGSGKNARGERERNVRCRGQTGWMRGPRARQPFKRLGDAVRALELARQHAHTDEAGAVDALGAPGNDGFHTETFLNADQKNRKP